jgi:hypothetical protein
MGYTGRLEFASLTEDIINTRDSDLDDFDTYPPAKLVLILRINPQQRF